jgi:hypothetical protein
MPVMIGEGIEEGEQQGQRKHQDQYFRNLDEIIHYHVMGVELMFIQIVELVDQIKADQKDEEAAYAVRKRNHQLSQQITIKQPHS